VPSPLHHAHWPLWNRLWAPRGKYCTLSASISTFHTLLLPDCHRIITDAAYFPSIQKYDIPDLRPPPLLWWLWLPRLGSHYSSCYQYYWLPLGAEHSTITNFSEWHRNRWILQNLDPLGRPRYPSIWQLNIMHFYWLSQTSFSHISINSSTILMVSMTPKSPWKDLLIDTSHVSKQSIMAEILGRSTGNHYGTVY